MLTETLLGLAVAVVASYVWERQIRDRITIHRVISSDDESTSGVIELYTSLFPDDGTNYSAEEITEMFTKNIEDRHVKEENIVLVARYHKNVVGFIFCHYYPDREKAIVSYFGIDKEIVEARRGAAKNLLIKLMHMLSSHQHKCEYLFYDLQKPNKSLSSKENSERKARPVLFRQTAKGLGKKAYEIKIDYESPKISLTEDAYEQPLILMFVMVKGKLGSEISKKLAMEFLNFIYMDCYGSIYPVNDDRYKVYRSHLMKKLEIYNNILPDKIAVK